METSSVELRVLGVPASKSDPTQEDEQIIDSRPILPESSNVTVDDEMHDISSSSNQLPPVDGGSAAWLLLASCFATELVCFGGAFSFSIFQEYLVQSPSSPLKNATNVQVSVIGTLLVSSNYFAPALGRGIWAHFSRWNRIMGGICIQLAGASLLIASFGKSVPFLIIFMGLFPGVFLGLSTLNYMIWLPQWFFKRRGLAIGITYSGAGFGGIIFPFVFSAALRELGFAWTLRIWAGIIMLGGGIASIPIRPRITPPFTASSTSFWNLFQPQQTGNGGDDKNRLKRWLQAMAFLSSPLWIAQALATFIVSMSFFCISFYLAVYCSSLGLKPSTSTGIVAGFNLAGLTGEIVVGHLCDRFPYPLILFGIGTIGTLSAFLLLGLVQSLLGIVFFVLLFGFAAGSFPSSWTSSAYDISRLKSMQTANVILAFTFVRGIAAVIGPLVAASLYDPRKNTMQAIFGAFGFKDLTIFVGTCMVGLVVSTPLLSYLRKKATVIVNQSSLQEQF